MSQRFRTNVHNRSQLLGTPDYTTPPASGRSSPFGGAVAGRENPFAPQRYVDDLEGQNDEHLEGLTAKVKILKDITLAIGSEVKDSTIQLSQMNDAFSETSGILAGTFRRMNNMAERQGCRWLWYIVFLILVFWFFIVVWWFRR
ncbi:hypothetical protein GSI_08238 [Ganoderma sinense ZZ0214-1]|uniref:t-SNARE coiled-coil homology domain-containing protein n=1 Tax=Ganoderma sinense ZZ0214-1 TaxID=1077348 RepID=A0A2G8S738_9APHY|nr:hypothetical protein GSI_08238 [Ganoderma sinense ZZ0214-1]